MDDTNFFAPEAHFDNQYILIDARARPTFFEIPNLTRTFRALVKVKDSYTLSNICKVLIEW